MPRGTNQNWFMGSSEPIKTIFRWSLLRLLGCSRDGGQQQLVFCLVSEHLLLSCCWKVFFISFCCLIQWYFVWYDAGCFRTTSCQAVFPTVSVAWPRWLSCEWLAFYAWLCMRLMLIAWCWAFGCWFWFQFVALSWVCSCLGGFSLISLCCLI